MLPEVALESSSAVWLQRYQNAWFCTSSFSPPDTQSLVLSPILLSPRQGEAKHFSSSLSKKPTAFLQGTSPSCITLIGAIPVGFGCQRCHWSGRDKGKHGELCFSRQPRLILISDLLSGMVTRPSFINSPVEFQPLPFVTMLVAVFNNELFTSLSAY